MSRVPYYRVEEKKISHTSVRPAPDFAYRLMVWTMKVEDLFHDPADLLKKVPLKEGMTVVDYACGPGRYAIPAAETVGPSGEVYAVDSQPLALEIVKKKAKRKSLANIMPVLVDSFDTGIQEASADVVLLIDAITPIRDRDSLFKEIHRLLKAHGLLFMDSSHEGIAKARNIVESTGLFDILKLDGKTMLLTKKDGA